MSSAYHLALCLSSVRLGLQGTKRPAHETGSCVQYKGESCLPELAGSQSHEMLAISPRVFTAPIAKSHFSAAGDSLGRVSSDLDAFVRHFLSFAAKLLKKNTQLETDSLYPWAGYLLL